MDGLVENKERKKGVQDSSTLRVVALLVCLHSGFPKCRSGAHTFSLYAPKMYFVSANNNKNYIFLGQHDEESIITIINHGLFKGEHHVCFCTQTRHPSLWSSRCHADVSLE